MDENRSSLVDPVRPSQTSLGLDEPWFDEPRRPRVRRATPAPLLGDPLANAWFL